MFDRRFLLLGMGSLAACASAPSGPVLMLARARRAAGGDRALEAVKELAWSGEAVVHTANRNIEIGVETLVRPFRYARSATWPVAQGRSAARTMLIEGAEGRLESPVGRTELSAAQTAHERLQFGLYALMLFPGSATVEPIWSDVNRAPGLRLSHRDAPATDFFFAPDGRLVAARNVVPDADTGARQIRQDFSFTGVIENRGVRWPQHMSIRQDDHPYFDLVLPSFEARDHLSG